MHASHSEIVYDRKWLSSIKPAAGWLSAIVFVYLVSRFLTAFVLKFDPYYIYVVAVGVVTAIVISRKLELAILIYAFLAPFIIAASPGYTGTRSGYQPVILPSEIGLVIISVIWVFTAIMKRRAITPKCSLYLPLLSFYFVCVLSIVSSYVIWDFSVPISERRIMNQVSEVGVFILCGVAFWMTASVIQRKDWITRLFWPVLFAGIYQGIVNLTGIEPPVNVAKGNFMTAFAIVMVLARLLFKDDSRRVRRLLWICFLYMLVVVYINLDWISGWLTASIAMLILLGYKSRKAAAAVGTVAFVLLFIYPGLYHDIYHESRSQGDMDRFILWHDSINMASSINPILGVGPGDYRAYSNKYASVWYGDETYDTPHSNYAQIIAECGYLGFAVFLWMLYAGIRVGFRTVRKVTHEFKWFTASAAAIFTAMSVTSLVGDYIMPSRANGGLITFGASVFPWLLLGASVAAVRVCRTPSNNKLDDFNTSPTVEVLQ